MALKVQKPTRDSAGNVHASAEVATRWGPVSIALTVPAGVFEAGAAPLIARGIGYGAEALGQTLLSPSLGVGLDTGESAIAYNMGRLSAVHQDPSVPLTHVLIFNGAPLLVDEVAHGVARNPSAPESVRAVELAQGMADSYDPAQKAYGQSELAKMRAACVVRALSANPEALATVRAASDRGDETAVAVRQALLASRFLDAKEQAAKLGARVQAGDKTANQQAQALFRLALQGNSLAQTFGRVVSDVREGMAETLGASSAPERAPAPPSAPQDPLAAVNPLPNAMMDPDEMAAVWARGELEIAPPAEPLSTGKDPIVGTISSSDGGVGCGCKDG